jgi:hypothetical protein
LWLSAHFAFFSSKSRERMGTAHQLFCKAGGINGLVCCQSRIRA